MAGARPAHVVTLGTDTVRTFLQEEVFLLDYHTPPATSACSLLPTLLSNSSLSDFQHTENYSCNYLQNAESMWPPSIYSGGQRRSQQVTTGFQAIIVNTTAACKTLHQCILHGLQQQQFSISIEIPSSLSPPNQITNDKPLQRPSAYRTIATLNGSQ